MSHVSGNVRWFMRHRSLKEQAAANVFGVSQPTVNRLVNASSSRPLRDPSHSTLEKIAKGMGVSVDALVNVDFEAEGLVGVSRPAALSQSSQLDLGRLGIALTSIDKALAGVEIQGKLGLLAEAIQFAYARAFAVRNPDDPSQRELFDELVASHLGGWNGRTGAVETSEVEHRKATSSRAKAGGRR